MLRVRGRYKSIETETYRDRQTEGRRLRDRGMEQTETLSVME